MARQRLHKRLFKALTEGYKRGYAPRVATQVEAKPLVRPVLPAQADGGSQAEFMDGKLRAGQVPEHLRETWGLNDGKEVGG